MALGCLQGFATFRLLSLTSRQQPAQQNCEKGKHNPFGLCLFLRPNSSYLLTRQHVMEMQSATIGKASSSEFQSLCGSAGCIGLAEQRERCKRRKCGESPQTPSGGRRPETAHGRAEASGQASAHARRLQRDRRISVRSADAPLRSADLGTFRRWAVGHPSAAAAWAAPRAVHTGAVSNAPIVARVPDPASLGKPLCLKVTSIAQQYGIRMSCQLASRRFCLQPELLVERHAVCG